MKVTVVGVFSGKSKKSNKPYYLVHYTEARDLTGMRGCIATSAFCTKEVADSLEIGSMYELSGEFGSNTVSSAEKV